MLRLFYVLIMNLYRLYMIPYMKFRNRHPKWFNEASQYRYAQHMIKLMKRTGRISISRLFAPQGDDAGAFPEAALLR